MVKVREQLFATNKMYPVSYVLLTHQSILISSRCRFCVSSLHLTSSSANNGKTEKSPNYFCYISSGHLLT